MKRFLLSSVSFALMVPGIAQANVTPYQGVGHENPQKYLFTASSTGDLSAYFYGSTAAFEENVGVLVNGKDTGINGLDNKTAVNGTRLDFGDVNKGDMLTFYIDVADFFQPGQFRYSSNARLNADMTNHVYATAFTGDPVIQTSGIYVGFEDLSPANSNERPDYNYTDTQFVFTNTTASVVSGVPEPSTWAMMLIGFAGLGYAGYQRSHRNKTSPMAA